MKPFVITISFLFLSVNLLAQIDQGLIIPTKKGRFGNASPITQASGLALDNNTTSFWTHNDQGNPTTVLYKFLPSTGDQTVTLQKQVNILNVENLDWEDLAQDNSGHMYICQVGKNCNANSDPEECPSRYIFKIHQVSLASLNHPDSSSVTPITYYFKYPLAGYDVNNCHSYDTVFVNCEAVIWHDYALYLFTKNIWSKPTNNCGGWIEGYTNLFKLQLAPGSSMQDPLIAQYMGKFNMKVDPSDETADYLVTGAAISPDHTILSLITYRRLWQFRNFTADLFFSGSSLYNHYSNSGSDTITRAYEGVDFMNNQYVTLCVDGVNGRISGIHVDSLAVWVRNTNDAGPGSLRSAMMTATEGDTLHFFTSLTNDTISLTSGPLIFNRNVHIIQPLNELIYLKGISSPVFQIPVGKSISLKGINLMCGNASTGGLINDGTLFLENVDLFNTFQGVQSLRNQGNLYTSGICRLVSE